MKLKKNDKVQMMSGKDKGRTGKIEKVFPVKNQVLVPGVNVYKKHARAQGQTQGGIIDITKPIEVSKVALICPKCKKPARVGYRLEEKNKVRICRRCQEAI
jgi:large subunit ribosomal protein L24